MRVTFLGTGDVYGAGGGAQSGYMVEAGGKVFLLDSGTAILSKMKKFGLDTGIVDFVAISHLHGDHFGGLPFLLLEYQFNNLRTRPLHVLGPPGIKERVLETYRVLFKDLSSLPMPFSLNFHEMLPEQPFSFEGIDFKPYLVPHQADHICLAIRVDADGKSLLYSGDTGWTDDLLRYPQGVDLFICECCYFETVVPYHLNYPTLLKHHAAMGCKRLILTHFGREVIARRDEIILELASEGMVVEVE